MIQEETQVKEIWINLIYRKGMKSFPVNKYLFAIYVKNNIIILDNLSK